MRPWFENAVVGMRHTGPVFRGVEPVPFRGEVTGPWKWSNRSKDERVVRDEGGRFVRKEFLEYELRPYEGALLWLDWLSERMDHWIEETHVDGAEREENHVFLERYIGLCERIADFSLIGPPAGGLGKIRRTYLRSLGLLGMNPISDRLERNV